MKTVIFLMFCWTMPVLSFGKQEILEKVWKDQTSETECIAITQRNIAKTEANLKNLVLKNETDIPKSELKRDLMRFKNAISGLENSITSCKAENPTYDFTEIDSKLIQIKADFEVLHKLLESENIAAKKTWVDVNKYSIFILSFPSSHPPQLDFSASYIFTRKEVLFYLSSESDDARLRTELNRFITVLNSESTKKAFIATINDMKEQVDKATAVKELTFLIRDVEHLQTVFSPTNKGFNEVISAAKKMQTRLGG